MKFKLEFASSLIYEKETVKQGIEKARENSFKVKYEVDDEKEYSATIEISTIKDLRKLIKIIGNPVVVDSSNLITVYDDYLE